MPLGNANIIKREITVSAPVAEVWARVSEARSLCSLFSCDSAARLEPDEFGGYTGKLRLDATLFKVRMRPYDALVTAEGCRLALRLTPLEGGGTHATAAVSCAAGCGFSASEKGVEGFLAKLAAAAGGSRQSSRDERTVRRTRAGEGAQAAESRRDRAAQSATAAAQKHEKSSRSRAWLAALGIIAAGAAAFALFAFWPFSGAAGQTRAPSADLSAAVSAENVSLLALGMSQSEVETLFGTEGLKTDGAVVYRSAELNGQSQPVRQIKAVYDAGSLASYTYLNLASAQRIGAVSSIPADAAALETSMTRAYIKDGEEYVETHAGYTDPFANFSPAWRGEVCVTANKATGATVTSYLKGYDGADPLMISSLEGSAAAHQYDDYDAFLADKLAFDEALLIANGYSRGDAARVFGECEEYDAGSGVKLLRARRGASDESGEPYYTYSFRYDADGAFQLGSFSNKRLYALADTLAGCKPKEVGCGQSYGEVRYLMPIVPTALYVNDNYYTVCYGRYTGGTDIKYQFELVVSFDVTTGVAEAVYDNTIPSAAD